MRNPCKRTRGEILVVPLQEQYHSRIRHKTCGAKNGYHASFTEARYAWGRGGEGGRGRRNGRKFARADNAAVGVKPAVE